MINYLSKILYLLGHERRKLPLIVLLFLGVTIFDLAGLGLIGPYVTLVLEPNEIYGPLNWVVEWLGLAKEQLPMMTVIGLMLVCIFLIKAVSAVGIHWITIRFSKNQQMRLQIFLMKSYQSLSYSEYLRRNSSEYIHSIQALTVQFCGVLMSLLRCASDGIMGLMILLLLAWTNAPALALLSLLLGSVVFVYDRIFRKKLKKYGKQINRTGMEMVQGIHEGIEGFKEIRVLGHELYFLNKVSNNARNVKRLQAQQEVINIAPRYIVELMMVCFIVVLMTGMLLFAINLKELLPTLSVFGVAALRLMPAVNMLSSNLAQLRFSQDAVNRLYDDLKELQSISKDEIKKSFKDFRKTEVLSKPLSVLEISNLSYRYPNASVDALKGITFRIYSGESIGLIGPSGSGKTTLVDVLLGMLEPQTGSITFNGTPLNNAISDWYTQAAYLPQQIFLIDNSLKRNVALGVEDSDIDETLLHQALNQARLGELVEQLPEGVETLLGERGMRLSGGQRQRVALARAFYHRRKVLVMDEATSALDDSTEKEIVEEIQHLKGKVTMIVIAHRLTTVQHCDRIYRLEKGCVVEEGRPEKVLRKSA